MKYLIIFLVVLVASAAIVNLSAPQSVPVGIADVKPGSHGLIRDEGGIGEMRIVDSNRTEHYMTEVTTKHPARESEFPFFGNN